MKKIAESGHMPAHLSKSFDTISGLGHVPGDPVTRHCNVLMNNVDMLGASAA